MALTKNGNAIGRAAQLESIDRFNDQVNAALNMSEEEKERVRLELKEQKEQDDNEELCKLFAPREFAVISKYASRKAYREALRNLASKVRWG